MNISRCLERIKVKVILMQKMGNLYMKRSK